MCRHDCWLPNRNDLRVWTGHGDLRPSAEGRHALRRRSPCTNPLAAGRRDRGCRRSGMPAVPRPPGDHDRHEAAAPFLPAARHRRPRSLPRAAGPAGADDPLRAAAQRQGPGPGAGTGDPGRRGARQPRGRGPGRPEARRPQGLHRHGAGDRLRRRRHRPVDAHQRPQQPVDPRRPVRDRHRGRRPARRRDGAEGRGALGHPLRRPAPRPARGAGGGDEADPGPRHPGDRRGGRQRRRHRVRLAADARHEPRTGRPRGLARHEDHPGRRRPSRLPGARRPRRRRRPARPRPAGPVALHHRPDGRCLPGQRHQGVLRPVRRLLRCRRLRGAVPQRLPDGLRRRLDPASEPGRPRKSVFAPTRPRSPSRCASWRRCPTAPAR